MLFLFAVHINTSFEAVFEALHLFSDMPLYGHVVDILIITNCYGFMNLSLQKFTLTKNQIKPFMKIYSTYENLEPYSKTYQKYVNGGTANHVQ